MIQAPQASRPATSTFQRRSPDGAAAWAHGQRDGSPCVGFDGEKNRDVDGGVEDEKPKRCTAEKTMKFQSNHISKFGGGLLKHLRRTLENAVSQRSGQNRALDSSDGGQRRRQENYFTIRIQKMYVEAPAESGKLCFSLRIEMHSKSAKAQRIRPSVGGARILRTQKRQSSQIGVKRPCMHYNECQTRIMMKRRACETLYTV